MDKASENANEQVAVAPVVRRKEKSGNDGKREAAEALEKTISAKKQKVEAEVKTVQAPPPKEEESTSTEEDTYSESDEEEVEAEVKKVQAPPPKEEESTSTEEDTYSESEEEEVSMANPKTPIGNQSEREVTTVFVGNLPSKVDEDDIAALFKEAGEVIEVRLARWKDHNSKGFCHVDFATEEAAKRALEMNQQEFMGIELRVQLAKPEKKRKDNSSIHKGKDEPKTRVGNQHEHGMVTIFVANLPYTANEDEIAAFFKEAGEVIDVRLAKGFCHVEFATEEAAKRALEMKQEFMGRELKLDMGTPKVSSTRSNGHGNRREHGGGRGRGGFRGRSGGRGRGGRGRFRN